MTCKVFPGIEYGTRFVFVGDSKTAGPSPAQAFPQQFAQLPQCEGIGGVVNLGVSGYRLADLVANYAENVKPYAPGQSLNQDNVPTVLGVWIGTNDVFQLAAGGYAGPVGYWTALYAYLAQAAADGFRIMLSPVDARGDHLDGTTEYHRAVVNDAIRHADVDWIVDTEAVFWNYADPIWWLADQIHYTPAGYKRLARLVAQTLLAGGAPAQVSPVLPNKTNTFPKPQAFTGRAIYVSAAPGQAPGIYFMENLVARFFLYLNASGDMAVDRHDNSGALLEQEVIKITRDTGELVLKRASRIA